MNYIYCITNLINNKRYVGKTTNSLEERFKEHCRDSRKDRCNKRPLYDAMNKYGIENFKIELLEEVPDEKLLSDKEIFWIKELGTYGSKGYNASIGGDGKILYDYREIIELANLGYCKRQVSEKIGCSQDTVAKVLKSHNIKVRKEQACIIGQYDMAGNFIQHFYGSGEACKWLYEHGYSKSNKGTTHILNACKHKIPAYCGYKWEYLPIPK